MKLVKMELYLKIQADSDNKIISLSCSSLTIFS